MERLDCVLEAVWWTKRYHCKALSIGIDTNRHGYLLNRGREVANELKVAGVDRISVSPHTQDKETYNCICRQMFGDAYESVRDFVKKTKQNFEVETTAVALPEVNAT